MITPVVRLFFNSSSFPNFSLNNSNVYLQSLIFFFKLENYIRVKEIIKMKILLPKYHYLIIPVNFLLLCLNPSSKELYGMGTNSYFYYLGNFKHTIQFHHIQYSFCNLYKLYTKHSCIGNDQSNI